MSGRRDFIRSSSIVGGAFILPKLEIAAEPANKQIQANLIILATNWGFRGSLDNFCAAAKKEGYNGIEVWVPGTQKEMAELKHTVEKHDLKLGLLTGGSDQLPAKHKVQFTEAIERAISMNPLYINCHSGKDYFEFEENLSILQASIDLSQKYGIPLYHETHRGRSLFAAPVTQKFIEKLPDLKLTLDISHWCNVHESLLQDQSLNVAVALKRTEHIHARVGHAEGPQVNDPRAPEWQETFNAHLKWWDEVVQRKTNEGKPVTILTEFGPPNYLPTLPYTQQPLADQWAINAYMMRFLRNRYSK
jgi:sugar phosphate isomerase/epimerase